jgi:uncharacterized protein with PQ loop repeat
MPIGVNILSAIAIFIFIVSALPQIRRLLVRKTAKDVSLWMSILIAAGNSLMLARAVIIHDLFFSANYACQLTLWLTIVVLTVRYH